MTSMLKGDRYQCGDLVYENQKTQIFKGRDILEDRAVILKILQSNEENPTRVGRLKGEYLLTRSLHSLTHLRKALDFEKVGGRTTLVFEDLGAETLRQRMMRSPLSLPEVLHIARQLADAIGDLHAERVIHKDINPDNILLAPQDDFLYLIDFDIACRLTREWTQVLRVGELEGTLPYLSPEQTGRVKASLDHRCDFYALGMTLYEVLTGQKPFMQTDPSELIYAHLARVPSAPHRLNPSIPQPLSDIVMKLIEKSPAERYQSSWGLRVDLDRCLATLEREPRIHIPPFPIGASDRPLRLLFPDQLIGRAEDQAALREALLRAKSGRHELVLISGEAGVGKTALVKDLGTLILEEGGFLLEGKFDIHRKHIPYEALFSALDHHLSAIEHEEETVRNNFAAKLQSQLGESLGQIMPFLPSLARLVAPLGIRAQPQEDCDPRALRLYIRQLIAACGQASQVLILFLDDLQWADLDSLDVLQDMMLRPDQQALLLIGAHRCVDAHSHSILESWLRQYKAMDGLHTEIHVKPWDLPQIESCLSLCLRQEPHEIRELAGVLAQKTHGNPFFMRQLLEEQNRDGHLRIDPQQGRWIFDLAAFQAAAPGDNVVAYLIERLNLLPSETRTLLQCVACLGHSVSWRQIAAILPLAPDTLVEALDEAVQCELLIPSDPYYRQWFDALRAEGESSERTLHFIHDRVQEAAYQSLNASDQAYIHLKIARALEGGLSQGMGEFDLLRHYNQAAPLIHDPQERLELARRNLLLARRSREAGSYEGALELCRKVETFAGENLWEEHEDLARNLAILTGECFQLLRDLPAAKEIFDRAYQKSTTALGRAYIQQARCVLLALTREHKAVLRLGREILHTLDFPLPASSGIMRMSWVRFKSFILLRKLHSEMKAWPVCTDERIKLAHQTIQLISSAAYFEEIHLLAYLGKLQLELGQRHGLHPSIALSVLAHAIIALATAQPKQSKVWAQVSFDILMRFNSQRNEVLNHLTWAIFAGHWQTPVDEVISALEKTFRMGIAAGQIEETRATLCGQTLLSLAAGRPLSLCEEQIKKGVDFCPIGFQSVENIMLAYVRGMQDETLNLKDWPIGAWLPNEPELLGVIYRESSSNYNIYWYFRCLTEFLKGDYQKADEAVKEFTRFAVQAGPIPTLWHSTLLSYLISVRLFPSLSPAQKVRTRLKLKAIQIFMRYNAGQCPENFEHQALFMEAEELRLKRRPSSSLIKIYRETIASARIWNFHNHEAFAAERLAELYLELGDRPAALLCYQEAIRAYERWGVLAKVRCLESQFPELARRYPSSFSVTHSSHTELGFSNFDAPTLIKASQALSAEIHIDSLLLRLLQLVAEHTGARYALLLSCADEESATKIIARMKIEGLTHYSTETESLSAEKLPLQILEQTMTSGRIVIIDDASEKGPHSKDSYFSTHRCRSILCLPILHKGTLGHVLYLENEMLAGTFHPARVELLRIICAQMAVSLENAKLFASNELALSSEKQARQREQKAHDEWVRSEGERQILSSSIEAARVVQESLLETGVPIDSCDFAWYYKPADRAGGDWFGHYVLEARDRLYLCLADVTGHGIPSALVSAAIAGACASAVDALSTEVRQSLEIDLQRLARAVNRAVLHTGARSDRNATMVLVALDLSSGEGEVLYAAHPLALLKHGSKVQPLVARGNLLGYSADPGFGTCPFQLQAGDILFLYSDGLLDNTDASGKSLRQRTLIDLIEKTQEAGELVEAVQEKAQNFMPSHDTDDTTFVALKWKGAAQKSSIVA